MPVLIGFLNDIEKDFFSALSRFPASRAKGRARALAAPFSVIAKAIDEGDTSFLQSLPGIGTQRAKEIVAKLQGKVGKYGLIQDEACQDKRRARKRY